jgi:hypothetical protein
LFDFNGKFCFCILCVLFIFPYFELVWRDLSFRLRFQTKPVSHVILISFCSHR